MKFKGITIFFLLIFSLCKAQKTELNSLSEHFLEKIKNGENTEQQQQQLANIELEELTTQLKTDTQKLAFWVNIYNAYIQVILNKNPELYENRGDFFSRDQITIAKNEISFDKIEHGIIRRSQSKIGLGYVKKGFPDKFERLLRVENQDYRIHFALNCGAKDCPPVGIYSPIRLNEQFAKSTELFLKQSSNYDSTENKVYVTSLFSWFRGDFGGKDGIQEILKKQGVIPTTDGVAIDYKDYNWTLALDNFIDL
ncbi:DUF547 domain-containing protein [Croceitalea rosinachiae]|uniref:DUF547 domain-containing protein n=1 Tax=Croceitalea rosinachiae TaxID=3075596 RepID=A0ABU3AB33_9FLAO|nr:DUF547 domain-containing protein [Croceitalea sp. F388]MDT0607113.1 DUF547 domain-containing protein [Croceitalea sp. F388]